MRSDNNFTEVALSTFAAEKKKKPPKIHDLTLSIDHEELCCRICLDTAQTSESFIRPCKCSGTVKHVHEECLKTWLVSLGKDLEQSKCELCHTKYTMNFIVIRRCLPRESCKNGAAHCLFIPILVAVMLMLFLIIYLLAQKYFTGDSTGEQQAYTIALSITCLIAGIIIIALIINSIKEACYSAKLEDWKILSQNFPVEENREVSAEELQRYDEMRSRTLVIPKSLKVSGKKVKVPNLKPMMTPMSRSGRVVAFSPRYFTPMGHPRITWNNMNPNDESYNNGEKRHSDSSFSVIELLHK